MPDLYTDLYNTAWVETGLTVSASSGLVVNVAPGTAYIPSTTGSARHDFGGGSVTIPAVSGTWFVDWNGGSFATPSGGAPYGYVRLASVTTDGTSITGVTDLRPTNSPEARISTNAKSLLARGDGVTDDSGVFAALSSGTVDLAAGTYRIATNIAISSAVTLRFAAGAMLAPDAGVTITINGSIDAPPRQIFACPLQAQSAQPIALSAQAISFLWVEWFGAKGDSTGLTGNGADNTLPLQWAINAPPAKGGITIRHLGGKYRIAGSLLVVNTLTYNYRSGLVFEGTAIDSDNNNATWYVHDPSASTDAMVKVYSRDCQWSRFMFTVANGGGVAGPTSFAAFDVDGWNSGTSLPALADPTTGTAYVCTKITWRECIFTTRIGNTTGAGAMTYGHQFGLNAPSNVEYMEFYNCDWRGQADTQVYVPSTTGQAKHFVFDGCHFSNSPSGTITTKHALRSASLNYPTQPHGAVSFVMRNCRFTRFTPINAGNGGLCIYLGNMIDASYIHNTDLENCTQFLRTIGSSNSSPLSILGGRFSYNGISLTPPSNGNEFISCGHAGPIIIEGCIFGNNTRTNDGQTDNFKILVQGSGGQSNNAEGYLMVRGCAFPNTAPFVLPPYAGGVHVVALANRGLAGTAASPYQVSLPDQIASYTAGALTPSTTMTWGVPITYTAPSATPSVSGGSQASLYYDAAQQRLMVSENGSPYQHLRPVVHAPSERGFRYWSGSIQEFTSSTAITGGRIHLSRIEIPENATINTVTMAVSVAGSGLTASQCLLGIYDSTGALLWTSADLSATWAGSGSKAISTGGITVTSPFVWVAMLGNGTTMPSVVRNAATSTVMLNLGLTVATSCSAFYTTGSQTSLPASFTPASALTQDASHWFFALS